ncbi:hypothetical protein CSUI_008399, partial [Cystoisospora suis]
GVRTPPQSSSSDSDDGVGLALHPPPLRSEEGERCPNSFPSPTPVSLLMKKCEEEEDLS